MGLILTTIIYLFISMSKISSTFPLSTINSTPLFISIVHTYSYSIITNFHYFISYTTITHPAIIIKSVTTICLFFLNYLIIHFIYFYLLTYSTFISSIIISFFLTQIKNYSLTSIDLILYTAQSYYLYFYPISHFNHSLQLDAYSIKFYHKINHHCMYQLI
jgi:hypothetical protein